MGAKLEIRDDRYAIIKDGLEIILTEEELHELNSNIDEIWFARDVHNYINEKGLLFNEDTVEDIINAYCYLRRRNDGDSEGMTWDECLDEAFEGHEYGDLLTDKMWDELKASMVKNVGMAAEFLDKDEDDIKSMREEDLLNALEDNKEKMQDELVEWYVEIVVE